MIRVFIAVAGLLGIAHAQAAESARDIIVKSVSADHNNVLIASHYTFRERQTEKDLDSAGRVKSTKIETSEFLFLGGKPYEHLVEKDDKPLPPDQEKKERHKLDKETAEAARLTDAELEKRLADFEKERTKEREFLQRVPDAYDFTLLGEGTLADRKCWMIWANPKSTYRGKDAGILRNVKGKIWVDQTDYQWVRAEAQVLNDISFGWFLVRLSKGSSFVFELARVNDEVWLPKQVTVKVHARALVKHFSVDLDIAYSDYRKYQSSSRVVEVSEQ
jgi:hypothetical protein